MDDGTLKDCLNLIYSTSSQLLEYWYGIGYEFLMGLGILLLNRLVAVGAAAGLCVLATSSWLCP